MDALRWDGSYVTGQCGARLFREARLEARADAPGGAPRHATNS